MTNKLEEHNKAIQELLEWGICERNKDGELKPTSDFLIWYYDHLIYEIAESYGERWLDVDIDEYIFEPDKEEELEGFTKRGAIENAIDNQIVTWTSQLMPDGYTYAQVDVKEHVKIIYRLIEEIDERLMHFHTIRQRSKRYVVKRQPEKE